MAARHLPQSANKRIYMPPQKVWMTHRTATTTSLWDLLSTFTGERVPEDALLPTSSLIMAVLISGAQSMKGIDERTGQPLGSTPNNQEGFGRISLQHSLPLKNDSLGWSLQVCVALAGWRKERLCGACSLGTPLCLTVQGQLMCCREQSAVILSTSESTYC